MHLARALVAAMLVTQAATFATTVYLHRALAHRALVVHPRVAMVFRLVIWTMTGIAPRAWVAVHRKHHAFGKRPYSNLATNNQWLALISAGEGLHNNHHAAPTSARFALDRGQIDPGWWLVRLLVRSDLASVRHEELKLKQPAQRV